MEKKIEKMFVPHLSKIKPYEPARPLEEQSERSGVPAEKIIRLNANENPYGPSPKVTESLSTLNAHIYPDPSQRVVRDKIAEYAGVDPSMVIAGAGSDEIIDMLLRLFISPGDKVIECTPTFGMYSFYGRITGAEIVSIPRTDHFMIDVKGTINAIDEHTKILFLNSPNNPTGNLVSREDVVKFLDTNIIVVVDEAYHEFARETVSDLVSEYENLVVLRSFSKWAGIAGLRAGYGIMTPVIVNRMMDIKSPFNINTAGQTAIVASLEDRHTLLKNIDIIINQRNELFSSLNNITNVKPSPSRGNYILCEFPSGQADLVFNGLVSRGIFVRKYSNPLLKDHLRISVGTPEQNVAVINSLIYLVNSLEAPVNISDN